MKTLTDFKRDVRIIQKEGRYIMLIEAPFMPNHKFLNVPKQVRKIQTNGIYMARQEEISGSFMDYPKAKNFIYDEDEFAILQEGKIVLKYKIF